MHFTEASKVNATRGIIIVDTSSLIPLCITLPIELLTEEAKAKSKPVSLSDVLLLLAQNGYKIVIPEMVSYEAGHILRDGHSIDAYFSQNSLPAYLTEFRITRSFLGGVVKSKGNISIEPPHANDASASANFMRSIWNLHTDPKCTTKEKRQGIIFLTRTLYKKDFGDEAAHQHIKFMDDTSLPVFYLAEDRIAAEKAMFLRQDISLHSLCIAHLFAALKQTRMLSLIGVADVSLDDFFSIFRASLNSDGLNVKISSGNFAKTSKDTLISSLAGLRKKLIRNINRINAAELTQPAAPVGADRFSRRWGSEFGSIHRPTGAD